MKPSPARFVLPGLPILLSLLGLATAGCGDALRGEAQAAVAAAPPPPRAISALGRLEPEDGVIRIAAPSGGSAVIADLRVDRGDRVEPGQVIAVLDTAEELESSVARLRAELANARRDLERLRHLRDSEVASDSQRDAQETRVRVLEAQLAGARAELRHSRITSPIAGRVLDVHARSGEQVGPDGIVELGRTDHMFAIAEVYEDEIGRVRPGQRARVSSPVLARPLTGTVERIRPKVAKNDVLGTDPAAPKDARVVEVEVRLDDSALVANLTHLQVAVEIEP